MRRNLLIVAIPAFLLVAVLAYFNSQGKAIPAFQSVASQSTTSQSVAPQSIAGFKQQKIVTGQQAINGMSELHGKEVGVTGGWIGYYAGGAIIWTAETKGEVQAIQLLGAMETRIGAGNQVFTGLQKLEVDGTAVYTVAGMGQKHFFYQKGDKVIWIAAPTGAEDQFFRQALVAIK